MIAPAELPRDWNPFYDYRSRWPLVASWPGLRSELKTAWLALVGMSPDKSARYRIAVADLLGLFGVTSTTSVYRRLASLAALGLLLWEKNHGTITVEMIDPLGMARQPVGPAKREPVGPRERQPLLFELPEPPQPGPAAAATPHPAARPVGSQVITSTPAASRPPIAANEETMPNQHVDDPAAIDWEKHRGEILTRARFTANRLFPGKPTRQIPAADRSLILKAAALSVAGPYSYGWLEEAIDATTNGRRSKPAAYLHAILKRSAEKIGRTCNKDLARVALPADLIPRDAAPATPSGQALADRARAMAAENRARGLDGNVEEARAVIAAAKAALRRPRS